MFRSEEDPEWKFQNLIGMLGSLQDRHHLFELRCFKTLQVCQEANKRINKKNIQSEFQNLIGMLGSFAYYLQFFIKTFVSKPYRYARKRNLSTLLADIESVSKPYRYARKDYAISRALEYMIGFKTLQVCQEGARDKIKDLLDWMFQNLIGMLGSDYKQGEISEVINSFKTLQVCQEDVQVIL